MWDARLWVSTYDEDDVEAPLEGIELAGDSPFATEQYDYVDNETEEDLTAPEPIRSMYVLI